MTIIEALKEAMRRHGEPMTAREAYDRVVKDGLYEFHAQNPALVALKQIRRHCEGIDFPTSDPTKHFRLVGGNRFWPLDEPKREPRRLGRASPKSGVPGKSNALASTLRELRNLRDTYIKLLRERVISDLRKLSPRGFELFSRDLLKAYGFEDIKVTRLSKDGGIDGHGRLKVGLSHLNVSFQCKRWTKGNIQRTEIDGFRGASQGEYEQAIFFATTSFSQGAIDASIKRGAVPVVLIDSDAIFKLMVEKRFGIEAESFVIPSYNLDVLLSADSGGAEATGELSSLAGAKLGG
jgi:restriction system protein